MSLPAPTPIPGRTAFLLAFTAFFGVEVGTRALYASHDGLSRKAQVFDNAARDEDKNLVILGTCLPEQHVRADVLQERIQGGWVVHNLGTEATSTLDWFLALENRLDSSRIDALVVAYGRRDLLAAISPWESRVTELAAWSDMPALVSWVCHDADCRTDLWLRKASATWRYRVRIANRAWAGIGALAEEAQVAPPREDDHDDAAERYYLQRLLETATALGVPVYLTPLPARPSSAGAGRNAAEEQFYQQKIDSIVGPTAAKVLALPPHPEEDFTDETHLTEEGSVLLTKELAALLRAEWGLGEPPEREPVAGPPAEGLGTPKAAGPPQGPPTGAGPPVGPPTPPPVGPPSPTEAGAPGGQPPDPRPVGAAAPPAFVPPPAKPEGPPLM